MQIRSVSAADARHQVAGALAAEVFERQLQQVLVGRGAQVGADAARSPAPGCRCAPSRAPRRAAPPPNSPPRYSVDQGRSRSACRCWNGISTSSISGIVRYGGTSVAAVEASVSRKPSQQPAAVGPREAPEPQQRPGRGRLLLRRPPQIWALLRPRRAAARRQIGHGVRQRCAAAATGPRRGRGAQPRNGRPPLRRSVLLRACSASPRGGRRIVASSSSRRRHGRGAQQRAALGRSGQSCQLAVRRSDASRRRLGNPDQAPRIPQPLVEVDRHRGQQFLPRPGRRRVLPAAAGSVGNRSPGHASGEISRWAAKFGRCSIDGPVGALRRWRDLRLPARSRPARHGRWPRRRQRPGRHRTAPPRFRSRQGHSCRTRKYSRARVNRFASAAFHSTETRRLHPCSHALPSATVMKRDIEILGVTYLRGPNMWTYRPVLEALSTSASSRTFRPIRIPGFVRAAVRLAAEPDRAPLQLRRARRLPAPAARRHLARRTSSSTSPSSCRTWPACRAASGKARETSTRGVYKVIVRAYHEDVTRAALLAARDLVMAAIEDRPFDVAATVDRAARPGRQPVARPEHRLHRRRRRGPRRSRRSGSTTATWCSSATARASAGSGPPKPTAPARSPRASRATRT